MLFVSKLVLVYRRILYRLLLFKSYHGSIWQKSSTSFLIAAERNPPSPTVLSSSSGMNSSSSSTLPAGGEKLRWRKDTFPWKAQSSLHQSMQSQDGDRTITELDHDTQTEGFLSSEINLVILDVLENIVQVNNFYLKWIEIFIYPFS